MTEAVPAQTPAETPARRRWPRSAGLSCAAIALGVIVVLVSSSPGWLRVVLKMGAGTIKLTGRGAAPAVVPLGLVAAAGLVAIALVRAWVRRVLAVLIAVSGAAVFAAAVRVVAGPDSVARGSDKVKQAGEVASVHLAGAPYVGLLGALLIIAGAIVVAVTCGHWPAPGRRYDRVDPSAGRPTDAWDALERGEDPTVG